MGVDEPRYQYVPRQDHVLARHVRSLGIRLRHKRGNAAAIDQQRVVREGVGGLDRDNEAGIEAEVYGLHRLRPAK
jgi:hypothetical protein